LSEKSKKDRLVAAATLLFHERGTDATSLADIAVRADVPVGNIYYYFKTKEELIAASIMAQHEEVCAHFKNVAEGIDNPKQRLLALLDYIKQCADDTTDLGCPMGKLVMNIDIVHNPLGKQVQEMFKNQIEWKIEQFLELGQSLDDAKNNAQNFCVKLQGAGVLAKALNDPKILTKQIDEMSCWIKAL